MSFFEALDSAVARVAPPLRADRASIVAVTLLTAVNLINYADRYTVSGGVNNDSIHGSKCRA